MNRYLIAIHAFMLLGAVLIRIFLTGRIFTEGTDWNNPQIALPLVLSLTSCFLLITGVIFSTQLIIAVRFYKNMFSDEGYLTHTLPVTRGQHLMSKTIAGGIWGILNMMISHIALYIIIFTPYVTDFLSDNISVIEAELGIASDCTGSSLSSLILLYIVTAVLGAVSNIILFYASIAIGQLVSNHKVLGAIAAYFAISTFCSIIMAIIMAVLGLLGASIAPTASFDMIKYFKDSLILSMIFCIIQSIVLYIAAYWIMAKKINLD